MGIARVTRPNARFFGVPWRRWRDQVLRASLTDPSSIRPTASRLSAVLLQGRTVRVRHPNGTDLTLALAGRRPNQSIGEVTAETMKTPFGSMASVPDATVYVAVDETTADGTIVANRPNTTAFERPVHDGRFTFRNGKLVRSSFGSGGVAFRSAYRAAGAGRDRPSFLEVGLDPNVDRAPLLEENEAGAVTVGVGRNAGFGGATKVDFLGYVTVAGAQLSIDGRPVARGGRLVVR